MIWNEEERSLIDPDLLRQFDAGLIVQDQSFGSFVHARRRTLRLWRWQLAHRVGVSDNALTSWERGRYLPYERTIPALAHGLECSTSLLYALRDRAVQPKIYQRQRGRLRLPTEERVLRALLKRPSLTARQMKHLLRNGHNDAGNRSRADIAAAVDLLVEQGLVERHESMTQTGSPLTVFVATDLAHDQATRPKASYAGFLALAEEMRRLEDAGRRRA